MTPSQPPSPAPSDNDDGLGPDSRHSQKPPLMNPSSDDRRIDIEFSVPEVHRLRFTDEADEDLSRLENDKGFAKRLKAVRKALGYLENNPRHPGLNTHKYDD